MGEGEACRVYAYEVVVGHCGCGAEKEQARGVCRQGKWEMGTGKEKRKARIGQHTSATLLEIPHIHIQIPNWAIYSPPPNVALAALYHIRVQTQIQNDSTQLRLHGPTTSYAYTLLGNSHPLHHTLGVVHNIVDEGRERNATTRVLPAAPGQ